MKTNRRQCHKEALAEGPLCAVDLCACGSLHATIGVITLRLAPDAAASVAETLAEAVRRLAFRSQPARRGLRLVGAAQEQGSAS